MDFLYYLDIFLLRYKMLHCEAMEYSLHYQDFIVHNLTLPLAESHNARLYWPRSSRA